MTRRLAIHILLAIGVCIASIGCKIIKGSGGMSNDPELPTVAQKPAVQPGGKEKPPKAAGGQGKVLLVDKELGFIVADFAYSQLPPAEQKYFVYRANQQVGVVIITGQSDETFLVADINKGDIRAGDLIRPE